MSAACHGATALAVLASIGFSGLAVAETLHVPGDYSTIQLCINLAVSGVDECLVAPGIYNETINFLGKAITVRSSDGADLTTIDGTGLKESVVRCETGEGPDTILDGFTITGGDTTYGGGMYNSGSSPTVTNCTFNGSAASYGGGMYNTIDSSPVLVDCVFQENQAGHSGGGMYNAFNCNPTLTRCIFSANVAGLGGGMRNEQGSPTLITCSFLANQSVFGTGGGGTPTEGSPVAVGEH